MRPQGVGIDPSLQVGDLGPHLGHDFGVRRQQQVGLGLTQLLVKGDQRAWVLQGTELLVVGLTKHNLGRVVDEVAPLHHKLSSLDRDVISGIRPNIRLDVQHFHRHQVHHTARDVLQLGDRDLTGVTTPRHPAFLPAGDPIRKRHLRREPVVVPRTARRSLILKLEDVGNDTTGELLHRLVPHHLEVEQRLPCAHSRAVQHHPAGDTQARQHSLNLLQVVGVHAGRHLHGAGPETAICVSQPRHIGGPDLRSALEHEVRHNQRGLRLLELREIQGQLLGLDTHLETAVVIHRVRHRDGDPKEGQNCGGLVLDRSLILRHRETDLPRIVRQSDVSITSEQPHQPRHVWRE